jgi:Domain of unknown function (DUF4340)
MNRLNKILIGLLVGQLALTLLLLGKSDPTAPAKPEPLLPGFDAARVSRLQVFPALDPDAPKPGTAGAPVHPEAPIDLARRGEAWVLASGFDYPAQAAPITELTGKLAGLRRTEAIASGAARHKQLGVAEAAYERKLIVTQDGKDTTIFVGKPVGSRQTAVRLGGSAEVYAVSNLTAWSIDPQLRTWVSPTYASVVKDDLTQVLIEREGEALQLVREPGGPWKLGNAGAPVALPAGQILDPALLEQVMGQLAQVDLVAAGDPKRDASKPKATISLWTKPPAAPDSSSTAAPADGAGSAAAAAPTGAPAANPAAAVPASGQGAATPAAPAAPAVVLTVLDDGDRLWVQKRGDARAVLVDASRLRAAVELSRAKLVVKETKPAPGAAPPAGAPGPVTPEGGSLPPGLPIQMPPR